MKINIVSIDNKFSKEFQSLSSEYLKQLKFCLKFIDLKSKRQFTSITTQKSFEAEMLLEKTPPNSYIICLDETGKQFTSRAFAEKLLPGGPKELSFLIGGAFGLDDSVKKRASLILSLSKMTFPHKLAKFVLIEQIYRAQQIVINHPYHK